MTSTLSVNEGQKDNVLASLERLAAFMDGEAYLVRVVEDGPARTHLALQKPSAASPSSKGSLKPYWKKPKPRRSFSRPSMRLFPSSPARALHLTGWGLPSLNRPTARIEDREREDERRCFEIMLAKTCSGRAQRCRSVRCGPVGRKGRHFAQRSLDLPGDPLLPSTVARFTGQCFRNDPSKNGRSETLPR